MDVLTDYLQLILSATAFVVLTIYLVLQKLGPPRAISPDEFREFPLVDKKEISHDTRRFTFALPSEKHVLGLPVGQHIKLRFVDTNGKAHQRKYTPVSDNSMRGKVEFVIKVYKAGVHPKFPKGGIMSQHLDSLSIGDTIQMEGPTGHMRYLGQGHFTIQHFRKPLQKRFASEINMIAGGTGITPMLQVLHAIFRDPTDMRTAVKLIYANQTEDDILVREELEALAKNYPNRFALHYTLDRPPPNNWKGSTGFVTKEMMEQHLFPYSAETQVFMCGPPPMIKFACLPNLKEFGFDENHWFAF